MTVTIDRPGRAESGAHERAVFRSGPAAPVRTLLDILTETTRLHPGAPAIDDGTRVLSYRELAGEIDAVRGKLAAAGIGAGDRVGVRVSSGTTELYVAVLAVLAAGGAYVPVDADDPQERADLVFGEAGVCAVLGDAGALTMLGAPRGGERPGQDVPLPGDDAWIIFTSGSTGTPKGVAVTHAAAAAFVDAEAGLFLAAEPLGPGDRVLAGLSVAFDASCEEMWLAWRNGACLVPAPRSLVRTGVDLGPWLVAKRITVVSTVPTLAALWPGEALDRVRLLIFGGEACPAELAERVAGRGREVWNTYGPTEATVVATAARLTGSGPVRIGLPLAGWQLAVVGDTGEPVAMGQSGELVIGGAGLARYLDGAKDEEKFAPLPSLGWQRAYRSGDLVRAEPEGLLFLGRADEQIKLGGRRIELGEIDAALAALPGVAGAAAAVRTTAAGNQVLVGYVVPRDPGFGIDAAMASLRGELPSALVPVLAVVAELPTLTSGKVDRAALPWPPPSVESEGEPALSETESWLAESWRDVLGVRAGGPGADFFRDGGGSLTAAQLVARIRTRYPAVSVTDVYRTPTLGALAAKIDTLDAGNTATRNVRPVAAKARCLQLALLVPLLMLPGLRWAMGAAAVSTALGTVFGLGWAPVTPVWALALAWIVLFSPLGRIAVSSAGARLLLRGLRPGSYPRGGGVHLRLWAAQSLADLSGATDVAGAAWMTHYARALGAKVGADVDLHAPPPVTGMLKLGKGAAVEPETDLRGYWVDGDVVHIGEIRIGACARIGARGTLLPGARVGKAAEVAAGSTVSGDVPAGRRWAGSPGSKQPRDAPSWPAGRAPRSARWAFGYGASSVVLGLLPLLAAVPALLVLGVAVSGTASLAAALGAALLAVPFATLAYLCGYALLVLAGVRALSIGIRAGHHPVHSRVAWQVWATERLMDSARVALFPLYASLFTPVWLRLLGAKVGKGVEASTVLALPSMTKIAGGAFLADDTMVATYELGRGWLHVGPARIGKNAFLGNSGMAAPGRTVPKRGLVGVLSSAPAKAKKGSSWLGMPPMPLHRAAGTADTSRTFDPPARLRVARAVVELCRVVPVMCSFALSVLVVAALIALASATSPWIAAAASAGVLLLAGTLAAAVTSAVKWSLVGRFRPRERPLWSSFVWRAELADTFVEVLAVPWFADAAAGTPLLPAWLRTMGASVGKGTWLETYWLPEADLVRIGDAAAVNRGCVVQTHLFHDRIMSMDTVRLGEGATLGPHGIVLPGASIGARTTVGPGSLVTRGDAVPPDSRWLGNPIAAWQSEPGGRRA